MTFSTRALTVLFAISTMGMLVEARIRINAMLVSGDQLATIDVEEDSNVFYFFEEVLPSVQQSRVGHPSMNVYDLQMVLPDGGDVIDAGDWQNLPEWSAVLPPHGGELDVSIIPPTLPCSHITDIEVRMVEVYGTGGRPTAVHMFDRTQTRLNGYPIKRGGIFQMPVARADRRTRANIRDLINELPNVHAWQGTTIEDWLVSALPAGAISIDNFTSLSYYQQWDPNMDLSRLDEMQCREDSTTGILHVTWKSE